MQCLHCAIGELITARQASGEEISVQTIGRLCEVIADIAASSAGKSEAPDVFVIARDFLARFERDIADGSYTAGRTIVPTAFRARH